MEQREEYYLLPEEKWARRIAERSQLWISIIEESDIDPEVKRGLVELIKLKSDNKAILGDSVDDWAYTTISALLTKLTKIKNVSPADKSALFENIRDDIWKFHKELNE
ncbi:MAG: hypothetical protein HYW89_02135 [Candidatus Sungiibacteriota bacterium]|uniref:Uncharacterized protein n=1 Tax=Candidatus Sungiibacteriota bacterium TaxID=2750080 RepID=A0A7T5URL2_9BACT|nr:MAG: hypothetical protein HYW89_02135 [Candidatus Sungbacteria bacterium]